MKQTVYHFLSFRAVVPNLGATERFDNWVQIVLYYVGLYVFSLDLKNWRALMGAMEIITHWPGATEYKPLGATAV